MNIQYVGKEGRYRCVISFCDSKHGFLMLTAASRDDSTGLYCSYFVPPEDPGGGRAYCNYYEGILAPSPGLSHV